MNRERYDKVKHYGDGDKPYGNRHEEADRQFGAWLTLPVEANDLQKLLESIGVDRPSESAFTITAISVCPSKTSYTTTSANMMPLVI